MEFIITWAVQDVSYRLYRFHMDRFNPKKLNMVEQYCVEISAGFTALKNLDNEVANNSAWETIRENINISAKRVWVKVN
jgi:hypothetical protein